MTSERDVLQFCAAVFKSVWALELLLCLRRNPDVSWQAADLVKELRCSDGVIIEALGNLTLAGLVFEDAAGYRYRTVDPQMDELVVALHDLYAIKPAAVIREIMTSPNMKLKMLSDAFRIKG
jgi:hypothetical protein